MEELEAAAKALRTAMCELDEAKKLGFDGKGSAVNDGHLVAALNEALNEYNISVQRYWCGALVGPDCRRLLAVYQQVLDHIATAVRLHQGDAEAADFVKRNSRVLKPLEVVSRITRRVTGAGPGGLLSVEEKDEVKKACAGFGEAWKLSYEDKNETPKAHIVIKHLPDSSSGGGSAGSSERTARRRCT